MQTALNLKENLAIFSFSLGKVEASTQPKMMFRMCFQFSYCFMVCKHKNKLTYVIKKVSKKGNNQLHLQDL